MKQNSLACLFGPFLILLLATACKKQEPEVCNTDTSTQKDSTSVIGMWEKKAEYNGMGGSTILPDCNGDRIEFVDSSTYKTYNKWQLVASGTYQIFPDTFLLSQTIGTRIVFDNNTAPRQFITNTGTKLSFRIDANDGPAVDYVKRNGSGQ